MSKFTKNSRLIWFDWAACAVAFAGSTTPVHAQTMSPELIAAMDAAVAKRATPAQKALLFAHNDTINRARLNDNITDARYQAAQGEFKTLNDDFARRAATDSGGVFGEQKPKPGKPQRFSPGTDSDYIIKVVDKDPVGKVKEMQARYNENVNKHLSETLGPEAAKSMQQKHWHNQLDVDFMVDPAHVNSKQFEQIAELNNDAYKRRNAAEFERISRAEGIPQQLLPEHFREYAQEMQDFIDKKQHKMEKYKANPALLLDPVEQANFHRMMAQEQKYIDRIEATNKTLRNQERLPNKPQYHELNYQGTINKDGQMVIRKRSSESIAAAGAKRGPDTFRATATGNTLAPHSTQRALRTLAESMAEAHAKNPGAWRGAPGDIAQLAERLPLSEKGRLIENIRNNGGDKIASQVAEEMRKRAGSNKSFDQALRNTLGVSDDLRGMSNTRRAFNEYAAKKMGLIEKLGVIGDAVLIKDTIVDMKTYVQSIHKALDPNISDAEADKLFAQAQHAANSMAMNGGMGVLFSKVPTLGAMYGAWSLGYDGTRFLLENTETGQWIDRKASEYADRMTKASERAMEQAKELLGGTSERMAREDQLRDLESRYTKLMKEGKIKLKPGATAAEVLKRIRAGDLLGLDELLEPAGIAGPKPKFNSEYMAWYNDVGWIHIGTIEQFHFNQQRRSETWGGTSTELLRKVEMLGGKHFDSFDDVLKELAPQIGPALTRHQTPLAFPKVHYKSGDKMIGFEIVNHPSFKQYKEKADNRK